MGRSSARAEVGGYPGRIRQSFSWIRTLIAICGVSGILLAITGSSVGVMSWDTWRRELPLIYSTLFTHVPVKATLSKYRHELKPGETYFREYRGVVVIEAEHFDSNISRQSRSWQLDRSVPGFLGEGYLQPGPAPAVIHWDFADESPELNYQVLFDHPGRYLISIRGYAEDEASNSVHVGLDREASPTSAHLSTRNFKRWTWINTNLSGAEASIVVKTPGYHRIQLWMRETTFRFDRIMLVHSSQQSLLSGDPLESERTTYAPKKTETSPAKRAVARFMEWAGPNPP